MHIILDLAVYFRLDRAKEAQACNPVRPVAQVVGAAGRSSSRIADQVIPAFLPDDHHEMMTAARQRENRNDGISSQQIRVDQFVGRTVIVGQFPVFGRDRWHSAPMNQTIIGESARSGQKSIQLLRVGFDPVKCGDHCS